MINVVVQLYNRLPQTIIKKIGKSNYLKFIREIILRKNGVYREVLVHINRCYLNHNVKFKFYASIKTAAKAYKSGIENKVLKNSITLINNLKDRNNDCFVLDIGSSFGFLSLVWSKSICQNQGMVVGFEPNKNVHKSFNKSIISNRLNHIIKNENYAIGSKCKNVNLYLNNTTSNTQILITPIDVEVVEMVTIDSYLKRKNISKCDLIKIDVDGIEYDVLKGCINTIKDYEPIFIIETNNDKRIIDFFVKRNYQILNMNLEEFKPNDTLQCNIFCIPSKLK